MSLPARLVACAVALLLAFAAGMRTMAYMRDAAANEEALAAAHAAIAVKDAWNKDIARHRQEAHDEKAAIAAERDAALERLRQRPARLPQTARGACQGATGAELSEPDGAFLVREAARADELRVALQECQAWIDTVTGTRAPSPAAQ